MFEDILQTFWVVVGAFSGVAIGLTFEGADFLASLRSVKGWQQIYHGSTPPKPKKIDNGENLAEPAPTADQEKIKQFLGTRPPELKTSTPSPTSGPYTNAPKFGALDSSPLAEAPSASPQPQPSHQAAPVAQSTPVPFALPVGTTSHPILSDPLPDIFGTSTSFMSNRPVQPPPAPPVSRPPPVVSTPAPVVTSSSPVLGSTPSPAAVTPPASPRVVNGSPSLVESYTDEDDMSAGTADETASPEANLSTRNKIKKLRKRISSKLKITKE